MYSLSPTPGGRAALCSVGSERLPSVLPPLNLDMTSSSAASSETAHRQPETDRTLLGLSEQESLQAELYCYMSIICLL